jgi:type III secretion system FlhB-like substrate exporter
MSGLDLLRLAADRTLAEHFEDIAKCILNNAKEKWNIHAVKMLVDLAEQVKARGTAPAEAYQSLAEVLWKAYQEQGLGNRD